MSGNKLKDFVKNHRRDSLITFAWILVLVGMFVRTPIEGGIVFGALLIVVSLLIAGYNMKIWDNLPLTSSWVGAISSILFLLFCLVVLWNGGIILLALDITNKVGILLEL